MSDAPAPPVASPALAGPGSVKKGVLICLGATVASAVLTAAVALVAIGVVQLAWVIPAVIIFNRRGETETAKGVKIFAGIVALLNATCWGILIVALSNADFR